MTIFIPQITIFLGLFMQLVEVWAVFFLGWIFIKIAVIPLKWFWDVIFSLV